jgi:hypothetical protein
VFVFRYLFVTEYLLIVCIERRSLSFGMTEEIFIEKFFFQINLEKLGDNNNRGQFNTGYGKLVQIRNPLSLQLNDLS